MKKDSFLQWMKVVTEYGLCPNRCCVCGSVIHRECDICLDCRNIVLHVPEKGACPQCGRPKKECFCLQGRFVSVFSAPLLYEGTVRRQLINYKFDNCAYLAHPFAKLAAQYMREQKSCDGVDFITFIPLGKNTFKYRRYNQAELFARELAGMLGIQCEDVLYKTVDTKAQHELPKFFRQGNLVGIYDIFPEKENLLRDKTVLLADDVATTGATLQEAAKTLLLFGAKEVRAVCIARRNIVKEK